MLESVRCRPIGEGEIGAPAMTRLRIAFFSYGLPVVGEKRGGVDRIAHDLANGLARRGHEVTVWSYDPRPEGAAYRVRPLPYRRFVQSWVGFRITLGYLGNFLALVTGREPADVIVAMGDSLLLPLLRRPVVRVMSGSGLEEALSSRSPVRAVHQLGVYVQELATALTQPSCVAISENTRRFNPFIRQVIPIGSDLSVFRPDASEKTREPSLLFVGVLGGRKRGAVLQEWFSDVIRPRFPTATLRMVSPPGPPMEGVRYLTGIGQGELAREYRRAWLYTSPSVYEGFGLPYVEALASGTPVVASPNPGSREVLEEGFYGAVVSDDRFAETVCDLLGDPARREAMVERGLRRAGEYDIQRTIDAYEGLLLQLNRHRISTGVARLDS